MSSINPDGFWSGVSLCQVFYFAIENVVDTIYITNQQANMGYVLDTDLELRLCSNFSNRHEYSLCACFPAATERKWHVLLLLVGAKRLGVYLCVQSLSFFSVTGCAKRKKENHLKV